MSFASTPRPPYFAAIFSSQLAGHDEDYPPLAERMVDLARLQPGFLGVETVRGADGFGITVSFWDSESAIADWRSHAEHTVARERGRSRFYTHFELRVARVELAFGGPAEREER